MYYNMYITVEGYIRPCAEIQIPNISIYKYSLKEAMHLPFFQLVRNIEQHLDGKCKNCVHNYVCIGCRGMAFTVGTMQGKEPFSAVCTEDPYCFFEP